MAKTQLKNSSPNFQDAKLTEIIATFAVAMKRANFRFIAETGRMTLSMQNAWEQYQEWCKLQTK